MSNNLPKLMRDAVMTGLVQLPQEPVYHGNTGVQVQSITPAAGQQSGMTPSPIRPSASQTV